MIAIRRKDPAVQAVDLAADPAQAAGAGAVLEVEVAVGRPAVAREKGTAAGPLRAPLATSKVSRKVSTT